MGSFRPTPDSNCNLGGFIRPTEKPVGHSPCATLPDHVTMSRGLRRVAAAAAAVPLQPGARGDRGRATGSVQRLVFSSFFKILLLCYVIIRAVKVSALIYAINVAAINAIKYFNAVNATLFTSGVFPDTKPLRACSQ